MLNPFDTIYGLRIIVSPDHYRELPEEVMPGIPWPPGFREEINAWMKGFFRPWNAVNDGEMLTSDRMGTVYMNPRTFERLKTELGEKGGA
jgi:hypothetical protein